MNLKRAYILLLGLYPRDYKTAFAAEMPAVFQAALIDHWSEGWAPAAGFALGELAGMVIGLWREWIAKLAYSLSHSNSYVDGHGLPDRLLMRPAGVAWDSYYDLHTFAARARGEARGTRACMNADQRFAFGSTIRRIVILACGPCRCGAGRVVETASEMLGSRRQAP